MELNNNTSIVMTKRMENNVNKETVWKATVTLWEAKTVFTFLTAGSLKS